MYTVYKHLDNEENIIYIGKSKSILHRQRQHAKNSEWFDEINSIEYCVLDSKIEMDIVELYLINTLNPKYNKKDKREDKFGSINISELNWMEFDMHEIQTIHKPKKDGITTPSKNKNSIFVNKEISMLIHDCNTLNKFQFNIVNYILYYAQNNKNNSLIYEIDIRHAIDYIYYKRRNGGFLRNFYRLKDGICSIKFKLFETISYDDNNGIITVKIINNIDNVKGNSIEIPNFKYLNDNSSINVGSLNLYEHFSCGITKFKLDDFRNILGVSGKYEEFKDFKKYVLSKVVKDFSEVYGIKIKFKELKFGNTIEYIEIIR